MSQIPQEIIKTVKKQKVVIVLIGIGLVLTKRPNAQNLADYGLANVPPITQNVVAETNFNKNQD